MPTENLKFAAPFFAVKYITDEDRYSVANKSILLNLGEDPIGVQDQSLKPLESVIVVNTEVRAIQAAVIIEKFDDYPHQERLFEDVKKLWKLAYDLRGEERLKGVSHYLSPKANLGNIRLSMYHSGSVPLNVGLHKTHPFCPEPGFREVHTQIVGFGKMQQCREQDLNTLYLEETLAPGATHRPMYDAGGNYPWHQYETITPSIFMAVEMLPEGAVIPQD